MLADDLRSIRLLILEAGQATEERYFEVVEAARVLLCARLTFELEAGEGRFLALVADSELRHGRPLRARRMLARAQARLAGEPLADELALLAEALACWPSNKVSGRGLGELVLAGGLHRLAIGREDEAWEQPPEAQTHGHAGKANGNGNGNGNGHGNGKPNGHGSHEPSTESDLDRRSTAPWATTDWRRACMLHRLALRSASRVLPPRHPRLVDLELHLALALAAGGEHGAALEHVQRARAMAETLPWPALIAFCWGQEAAVAGGAGLQARALAAGRRSLEHYRTALEPRHPGLLPALWRLAELLPEVGGGSDLADEAEAILRQHLGRAQRPRRPSQVT